jgi:Putative amidoligase enzyme
MKSVLFCILLVFSAINAFAATFLEYSETQLFVPEQAPRIGLEIELTGLTQQEMGEELQKQLGGTLQWIEKLEDNLDSQTRKIETYTVHELHLIDSLMKAPVVIKPEDNVTANTDMAAQKAKTRIYEIVTPPIYFVQAIPLQTALDNMQAQGALGTLDGHAVAIQVNVEMGEGDPQKISALKILAILRNYLKPEHRESIALELQAPEIRQSYLGMYTPGMMERILDTSYRPSNKQFFFDFMYRQSLELLGVRGAWIMPEQQARKSLQQALKNRPFDDILPVVKWNFIRTSAVLMFLYPNDWLSRYLTETTWFHKYPILEFREANSDFQLLKRIKQFLGIVQYSESHGDIVWTKESVGSRLQCRLLF